MKTIYIFVDDTGNREIRAVLGHAGWLDDVKPATISTLAGAFSY